MMKWIELHDNVDGISPIYVNINNIVSFQEDIIDKSGDTVTRIDTVDRECIYVHESYEYIKELIWLAN